MIEYSVGFMFSQDRSRVLLIRKQRPDWMRGKLNGIGGKLEAGESPLRAMVREFEEETGIAHSEWTQAGVLSSPRSRIYVFHAIGDIEEAVTMTDERVERHSVASILLLNGVMECVPNMLWLIPYLCLSDAEPARQLLVEYA